MSPYIEMQARVVKWLRQLKEESPEKLKSLIASCRVDSAHHVNWIGYAAELDFFVREDEEGVLQNHTLPEMILEQVDDSGDMLAILNVRGIPLEARHITQDPGLWRHERIKYLLRRDEIYAQVGALMVGDVLINGEEILSRPRDGGNATVLVHLSWPKNDPDGHWESFDSSIVLTLMAPASAA